MWETILWCNQRQLNLRHLQRNARYPDPQVHKLWTTTTIRIHMIHSIYLITQTTNVRDTHDDHRMRVKQRRDAHWLRTNNANYQIFHSSQSQFVTRRKGNAGTKINLNGTCAWSLWTVRRIFYVLCAQLFKRMFNPCVLIKLFFFSFRYFSFVLIWQMSAE